MKFVLDEGTKIQAILSHNDSTERSGKMTTTKISNHLKERHSVLENKIRDGMRAYKEAQLHDDRFKIDGEVDANYAELVRLERRIIASPSVNVDDALFKLRIALKSADQTDHDWMMVQSALRDLENLSDATAKVTPLSPLSPLSPLPPAGQAKPDEYQAAA